MTRPNGTAVISPCGRYRYHLTRSWTRDPRAVTTDRRVDSVTFLMLNPSTADAMQDDPTIRRCIGFAKAWGAEQLRIVNLFALRATDPRRLRTVSEESAVAVDDPVGPDNDHAIETAVALTSITICAWGAHGTYRNRAGLVLTRLRAQGYEDRLRYLSLTKNGIPGHPLYLKGDLQPKTWAARPDPESPRRCDETGPYKTNHVIADPDRQEAWAHARCVLHHGHGGACSFSVLAEVTA